MFYFGPSIFEDVVILHQVTLMMMIQNMRIPLHNHITAELFWSNTNNKNVIPAKEIVKVRHYR